MSKCKGYYKTGTYNSNAHFWTAQNLNLRAPITSCVTLGKAHISLSFTLHICKIIIYLSVKVIMRIK